MTSSVGARPAHPRLYFTPAELAALRDRRGAGRPAVIWSNLVHDARRCARGPVSAEWIAPVADDPVYENLYDRFWAMMSDAAAVEQLAFAVAYGGTELRDAAVHRLLAACERWRPEADLRPDYGTAYATTRILKAIAIGYDLLFDELSVSDVAAVRTMLEACGDQLATEWFARPAVHGAVGADAEHHSPHHASVEWSAFGVIALCLLDESPSAPNWLDAAVQMFTDHLLGATLAVDGSQSEGSSFWASTVTSQFQFLDPLRRNGGPDLLERFARSLDPSMALAVYRPDREGTSAGEPIYGPSTAISAALACLARELRDPALLRLAAAEPTTGRLETFPARTPRRGEQLRMAPGGYAYAWYPSDLEPGPVPARRSWYFPTAGAAYLRTGWGPDDLLVAVEHAKVTVWAGSELVYEDLTPSEVVDVEESRMIGTAAYRRDMRGQADRIARVDDDGEIATVVGTSPDARVSARVVLDRRRRRVEIDRDERLQRTWVANPSARASIEVTRGSVVSGAGEHRPDLSVGYGLLDVTATDPVSYPTAQSSGVAGRLTVRIQALADDVPRPLTGGGGGPLRRIVD